MGIYKLAATTIVIISTLFWSKIVTAKEYVSIEIYNKSNPNGKHNGMDGNWLKADREQNNEIWNQANRFNIKKQDGYLQYQDLEERCSFYKWFQQQTDSLGFETRWASAARSTTKKLKHLLNPMALVCGNSNRQIQNFVTQGNAIIFDDIWKDLKSLIENQPVKGKAAEIWDGKLLLKEQNLIEPYYQKLSRKSIRKLERSLKKENAIARLFPGYEFEGSLLSVSDRWLYGMKLMKYHLL
ncbi:hypothetical protein [Pedobacter rhizosphaerae]|uniref:Uncharacterized protein n=1 Tax=Pedobacter rhizosphaerae TaxID=390241 RepID=A0A1H9NT88_9SPHI|nr:hypothetical protein [Pedobacter rhizosphaerae]SER39254.1 hypothetical protein SAMN04488023_108111 [Pedobacter rhizosphaerae]